MAVQGGRKAAGLQVQGTYACNVNVIFEIKAVLYIPGGARCVQS